MALSEITAAVLVGGRSRRMGRPKALLRLDQDGPTILERVVARVSSIADDVVLVGDHDWPLPPALAAFPRVSDDGQGAASGLLAALRCGRNDLCLVLGCDMPFVDVSVLARMVTIARGSSVGVVAVDDYGAHPLHAVYRAGDDARVARMVAAGERSLTVMTDALGMHRLDLREEEGSARWSVFNVNTPEELAIARRHATEETPDQ